MLSTYAINLLGTPVRFSAKHENLPELLSLFLPPCVPLREQDAVEIEYSMIQGFSDSSYVALRNQRQIAIAPSLVGVLQEVITDLQVLIAGKIKNRVFIHAAVVAVDGKAIILPGQSGVGKSTITATLIQKGAQYLSDEFALIDSVGMVHPYARYLAIKNPASGVKRLSPESLGATTFEGAAIPKAVVFSRYMPGADNAFKKLSRSELILNCMPHCLGIRSQVSETLVSLDALSIRAQGYSVERGEACEFAEVLLDLLN